MEGGRGAGWAGLGLGSWGFSAGGRSLGKTTRVRVGTQLRHKRAFSPCQLCRAGSLEEGKAQTLSISEGSYRIPKLGRIPKNQHIFPAYG